MKNKKTRNKDVTQKTQTITYAQQARRGITDSARDENSHPPKAQMDHRHKQQTKTRVRLEVIR